jgi:hypothetical protein
MGSYKKEKREKGEREVTREMQHMDWVTLEFFRPKYLHDVHLKMNGKHCS